MLRIRVPDTAHAPGLIEHLRTSGCIAYAVVEGVVGVLLPDVPWREEEARIRAVVEAWQEHHADADLQIEPLDA